MPLIVVAIIVAFVIVVVVLPVIVAFVVVFHRGCFSPPVALDASRTFRMASFRYLSSSCKEKDKSSIDLQRALQRKHGLLFCKSSFKKN